MQLKPGSAAEYKDRHKKIWPELKSLLSEAGIYDYSIFLDEETNILFAVQKNDGSRNSQDLGQNEIVRRWWAYMSDIMATNEDNSPRTRYLSEVFRME